MDTETQRQNLVSALESNRYFESLLSNPDFNEWREKVVMVRLNGIKDQAMSVDRTQPDWKDRVCDLVISYQEARLTYDALFTLAADTISVAREQLSKLPEAPTDVS